jgi:hypothetical protein
MTDFSDACFGCGGHLRRNVYSGTLCPECEKRTDMDAFGRLTECRPDPFGKAIIAHDIADYCDLIVRRANTRDGERANNASPHNT